MKILLSTRIKRNFLRRYNRALYLISLFTFLELRSAGTWPHQARHYTPPHHLLLPVNDSQLPVSAPLKLLIISTLIYITLRDYIMGSFKLFFMPFCEAPRLWSIKFVVIFANLRIREHSFYNFTVYIYIKIGLCVVL